MNQKGFSTLLIVIILGTIVLSLSISFYTNISLGFKNSVNFENSAKARGIVNSCLEVALEKIKLDNNYSGMETLLIDSYQCNYEIINQGGDNRLILASTEIKNIVRKLEVNTINFNPLIISSWREKD